MKYCFTLLFFCSVFGQAQNLEGLIMNEKGRPVSGAHIIVSENRGTFSSADGTYQLRGLQKGATSVRVTHLSYETIEMQVLVDEGDNELNFTLHLRPFQPDEVLVTATKAGSKAPMAYSTLKKEDFESINLGVDVPYLLDQTPSVVVTSDAGTGIGYTGVRLRGSDPTRVNVVINGIPLNDSESQSVFWVDLPDFASSVNNIQIQRGVGTSTNGAGAFGGTINLETASFDSEPSFSLNNTIGSFGTYKNNLEFTSGLLAGQFTFSGRLSRIHSDGYIDRASADLNSFFASAAWWGKKTSIRANIFSGKEITYQAWNGVLSDSLTTNRTYNSAGLRADGGFHPDEVDNYTQTHYQLHLTHEIAPGWSFGSALHYTKGKGYFEQYRNDDSLADYGLASDTSSLSSDLIRRRWLDNDFYGFTWHLQRISNNNRWKLQLGGGANQYEGRHFGEVIWARQFPSSQKGHLYYDNDATKYDVNAFIQSDYDITPKLNAFVDLQLRWIDYSFVRASNGANDDATHTFFNPKLGFSYRPSGKHRFYASFAKASREPNRNDYVDSSPESTPEAEQLFDYELGHQLKLNRLELGTNLYYMQYKKQLALDGGVNDVGEYTRINIPKSYRMGAEFSLSWQPLEFLRWKANATVSTNKISQFTEVVDAFNAENDYALTQQSIDHGKTDLAFSPNLIASSNLSLNFKQNQLSFLPKNHTVGISLISKYVGSQFIYNTSRDVKIDAYLVNDLLFTYQLKNRVFKDLSLNFQLRNILDATYESNAYAFRYIVDHEFIEEAYYYPQAGINYLLGLSVRF